MNNSNNYYYETSQKVQEIFNSFDSILEGMNYPSTAMIQKKVYKYLDTETGLNEEIRSINSWDFNDFTSQLNNMVNLVSMLVARVDGEEIFNDFDNVSLPVLTNDFIEDVQALIIFMISSRVAIQHVIDSFVSQQKNNHLQALIEEQKRQLDKTFYYEFTEGDKERVQQLINELRQEVTKSEFFEDEHRARLLKKLESLQNELHKKMSDLDRFYGLLGDAGVALKKFGNDAKPIVDRAKEITQIVWRTQSHSEELPSGTSNPLLQNDSSSHEE